MKSNEILYQHKITAPVKWFYELSWADKTQLPEGSRSSDIPRLLNLVNKFGLDGIFEYEIKKQFGLKEFPKDRVGRDEIYLSEDVDGKNAIYMIRDTNRWKFDRLGNPENLIKILVDILEPLVKEAQGKNLESFKRREEARKHLRVSKGYCSGSPCSCSIGVDING